MTRSEKILMVAAIVIGAAVFGFLVKVESPSQSLGFTSVSQPAYVVTSTATQATTTLYTFPGILHTVSVTKPVPGSVITIYDSATSSALATIAPLVITIPAAPTSTPFTLTVDAIFNNGFTIQQSTATSTVTVTYQQN